ncbi:hypothetical protein BX616_002286 [Lobosporangium transversale]|uniref:TspO/MBR family-domain-containing protein n=1 Tax=Lobosporangium transversale TaxID=64571 RepID=A0A1Y2H3S4_9FUNG|nr:TspO/MBR family-domain-containing protein [Lobosporangium transversale]KAF9901345.1 hypothetical protein BX616_002286 [Lobosporangium transversale]ORZ28363.1 TspO/MBR family-domain-containing protein [Lobosporangium transversale]|eukprot:XP_021886048.1 TspO/MBR family-domain-containing protein [Lobosporangium transversale]
MSGDNLHQACQSLNTNLARYPIMAVGLPLVGGFLSATPWRDNAKIYYESARKPSWAPPARAFAPVWTALYISIGYASHLVALRTGPYTPPLIRDFAKTGLGLYGLNLAFNFAFTPIRFGMNKLGAALVTITGATVSSVAMAYYYFKVDKHAGYLTIPYVAWLGYATALSYDTWVNNAQGPAADHARKLGKDVNDVVQHARDEIKDAAVHIKEDARDAARSINKHAKDAVNHASHKVDEELK